MKPNIKRQMDAWTEAEYPAILVPGPKDAVHFDQMLVVYLDDTKRYIRSVSFYDSRTDKIVATF